MAAERIVDMTLDELRLLIDQTVQRRLQEILRPAESRGVRDILDSIEQHRWTPPSGAPSTLKLLRDDRDA